MCPVRPAVRSPQSAENDILELTARPRRTITGKLTDSTSNREHIVAGHNVRTMLHVLYVERVRVVANMDNICPLNHLNEAFGKNDELIEVAQPLGGSATQWQGSRHDRRTYDPSFMSSRFEATLQQRREALHAFLTTWFVVSNQEDFH